MQGTQESLALQGGAVSLHLEILSEGQSAALPQLGAFAASHGFYLAGGTAVALHFGHRRSVDFDWFTSSRLDDPMLLAAKAREVGLKIEEAQTAPGTLHGVLRGVRVSFLEYPYPVLADPLAPQGQTWRLASLEDLSCMKLAAVAQRGSRKDFIDLHAIAAGFRPFPELLELYKKKYSTSEIAHVLIGLSYFDDAEEEPVPVMLREVPWEQVKSQCREWARLLAG